MKLLQIGLLGFGCLSLAASSITSHKHSVCKDGGYIPKEFEFKLYEESVGAMTEDQFNEVIDKVANVYGPIFEAKGTKLVMERLWDDDTVNASAYYDSDTNESYVTMYGGLARHRDTTMDSFAVVICHEVGHHLGQRPFYTGSSMSTEGQSDYFSTLKCFRKVFSNDNNVELMANEKIPAQIEKKCTFYFKEANDQALCMRAGIAGLQGAKVLQDAIFQGTGEKPPLDPEDVDKKVVKKTFEGHPMPQCRYDTYLAGSACPVDASKDLDAKDENVGACSFLNYRIFHSAARPLCWHKPEAVVANPSI